MALGFRYGEAFIRSNGTLRSQECEGRRRVVGLDASRVDSNSKKQIAIMISAQPVGVELSIHRRGQPSEGRKAQRARESENTTDAEMAGGVYPLLSQLPFGTKTTPKNEHIHQQPRKLPTELLPPPSPPIHPNLPRARTRPSRSNPCIRQSPAASGSSSLDE